MAKPRSKTRLRALGGGLGVLLASLGVLELDLHGSEAQLYRDLASGPFFGYNRPGAKASQGVEPGRDRAALGSRDRELFFRLQDSLFAVPIARAPALRVGSPRLVLVGASVSEPYHANYDVAPEGRSFVFIRQVGGSSLADVTVVLNRFASPFARSP